MRRSLAVVVAVPVFALISAPAQARIAAPRGVSATAGNGGVVVSWRTVKGAKAYRVSRCALDGASCRGLSSMARVRGRRYLDRQVLAGRGYGYRVTAVARGGRRGAPSRLASVRVTASAGAPVAGESGAGAPAPAADPLPRLPIPTPAPLPPAPALPGPAPTPTGPAATVFLSPSGSDSSACTNTAPCRTFDRAYRVAGSGDTVELAAGSYADQWLNYDASKTSAADVVFRPAAGTHPVVGFVDLGQWNTDLGARHVTFQDLTIDGFTANRAQDVTFRNVTMHGNFWTNGSDDVSIIGGSVGGTSDGSHPDVQVWRGPGGATDTSERILIDGVRFHDVTVASASDHVECLQVSDVRAITIRNSHFGPNCDTFDLHIQKHEDTIRDVLVENNTFDPATDSCDCVPVYYGLSVRDGINVTIRNNSSAFPWIAADSGSSSNWKVVNNILVKDFCHEEFIAYSHNVWISSPYRDNGTCGAGDKFVSSAGFAGASDYRLANGSPAVDAGDPASYPVKDMTGAARPRGAGPDAGAYESR
jgi:hypothetical protein